MQKDIRDFLLSRKLLTLEKEAIFNNVIKKTSKIKTEKQLREIIGRNTHQIVIILEEISGLSKSLETYEMIPKDFK